MATYSSLGTSPTLPSDQPATRLQVAVIRQQYRSDGGAERYVASLLTALQGTACDVTLIARNWGAAPGQSVIQCNPPKWGRVSRERGFARAVQEILRRQPFDLVQSNERIAGCDVYRAGDGVHHEWLAQRARVVSPLMRRLTDFSPYHAYVKNAERAMFSHPALRAVICNSHMVRQEIQQWFGVDDARLHVIHNGVDTDRFHPDLASQRTPMRKQLGVPDAAPLLLFVGSGFERKGLPAAIRAVAAARGAHLAVVGKDKRAKSFARLAARCGCRDRIHFAGVQNDVAPYYGAADSLLLPTLYDPFPNVVLEAMAAGLPVVSSRKCGAAELLAAGDCGFVVDALDVAGLTQAITTLAQKTTATAMGRRARQIVEPFTLGAMRAKLQTLYAELLHDRHPSRRTSTAA
ncbi:MAG: glycosyltransferase family 4 protein [Planctomycetales bacterium]|nr:glycosyltransferase family 4 protein [Planctomycetales bacterium]